MKNRKSKFYKDDSEEASINTQMQGASSTGKSISNDDTLDNTANRDSQIS